MIDLKSKHLTPKFHVFRKRAGEEKELVAIFVDELFARVFAITFIENDYTRYLLEERTE